MKNKKLNHTERTLKNMSKKQSQVVEPTLREQYNIIKKDVLKLRDDISKGYDLAKGLIEKKGLVSELLKAR